MAASYTPLPTASPLIKGELIRSLPSYEEGTRRESHTSDKNAPYVGGRSG
ncbi:MAG: hypothetical protein N4A71_22175 [Carboxylicivirga sp.]|nr:hypothetical protein [Carboxylicivirga sp.]MCT4645815.1 hypothetical protein [Carboxylicivirga sp.]